MRRLGHRSEPNDIDGRIDILTRLTDVLNTEISSFIVHTKRRRNELVAKIYQLPVEILTKILLTCCRAGSINSFTQQSNRLASVSAWFRTIVDSCPLFWSVISSRNPANWNATVLSRAKNLPLTLQWTSKGYRHEWNFVMNDSFKEHIDRWAILDVESEDLRSLEQLELPIPILASARITEKMYSRRRLNLSNGNAPLLRHLGLTGVFVVPGSQIFAGLETLVIGGPTIPMLTLLELLSPLTNSRRLRELMIRQIEIVFGPPTVMDDFPTVYLPTLSTLRLQRLSSHTTFSLLRSIRAPTCTIVHVSSTAGSWPLRAMEHDFLAIALPACAESLTAGCRLLVTIRHSYLLVKTENDDVTHFSLKFNNCRPLSQTIRAVVRSMEAIRLARTVLQVRSLPYSEGYVWSALQELEGVEELETSAVKGFGIMLQALSTPIQNGKTERWMFPRVRRLRFFNQLPGDLNRVLRMVQMRYRDDEKPDQIVRLEIADFGQEFAEDICAEFEAGVGWNVFSWDVAGETGEDDLLEEHEEFEEDGEEGYEV